MNLIRFFRFGLARWWPHSWRPALFVVALLLGLAVYWATLLGSHNRLRQQARADTQMMAGQTAEALALHMNTVVRQLDYFTQHLGWVWLNSVPETFNDAALVAMRTLPAGALAQVAVVDQEGRVRYSTLSDEPGVYRTQSDVTIADREHFKVHTRVKAPFFYISRPIQGRISQKWTIQFTRGLWQDGEFQGVMILAVSADYLATALKAIFPDPTDAATLINSQGTYLARSYYLSRVLGSTLPQTRPFIDYPNLDRGDYEVEANVDGIARLYSWQRVEGFPLVVLVGLGTEKAMAVTEDTLSDSLWQSGYGSGLLLLAGVIVAGLSAQRSMRSMQLQRVADALQASEAQLRITLDAVRDGLWTFDHRAKIISWDKRILNMLGYEETCSAPPVDKFVDLIHPIDLKEIGRETARVFAKHSDHAMNLQLRLRKSDGRWLWVLARGRVIERSRQGAPLRSVGTLSDVSEQVAEAHLRNALLDRSVAAILVVDPDRRVVDANAQFRSVFLKPGQALIDLRLRDLHIDEANWIAMGDSYATIRAQGEIRLEYPYKDAGGNLRWFDVHGVLQDPDDAHSNTIWTWIDITSRHNADTALAIETVRLNTVLESFPGGVLIEDPQDTVVFVNALWVLLLGVHLPPSALVGVHDSDLRAMVGPKVSAWMRSLRPGGASETRRSHEVRTEAGRHLEIDHIELAQNGDYLGSVWMVRDITERKLHELELAQLASTDTLTGLPNRRSFMHTLNTVYESATRLGRSPGVVMMLDIDFFKRVNDSYGHSVGDVALQRISGVISNALRSGDTPGRLGGEEFACLLPQTDLAEGIAVAERIRQRVEETTIRAEGHEFKVTISIGVSKLSVSDSTDAALQRADDAMYMAKKSGRNRVVAWEDEHATVS